MVAILVFRVCMLTFADLHLTQKTEADGDIASSAGILS